MNTPIGLKDLVIDNYQLGKSKVISHNPSYLKLGFKEDSLKNKNNNQLPFDLNPQWKSKHLSYALKPKVLGQEDHKASFISKEAPSTCPTSIKSLEMMSKNKKDGNKMQNPMSSFKNKHFQKSQKYLSFNMQTLSEHRRKTLYNPLIRAQQSYCNKSTDNKVLKSLSGVQPRTPQHSKNRQQKVSFFDRYLEHNNKGKNSELNFSKQSTFKSQYQGKSDRVSHKRGPSFPNMKMVQSEDEDEQEDVNSSIVISKCLVPSYLTFKQGTIPMFKSHLKPQNKTSCIEDMVLRRKTASDIKQLAQITTTKN